MFPEDKIIEIFSMCDDFSKVFDKTVEQNAMTSGEMTKKRKYPVFVNGTPSHLR